MDNSLVYLPFYSRARVMVYVPCISTIAALVKEFGFRRAWAITVVEIMIAVILGGVILRVFQVLGFP